MTFACPETPSAFSAILWVSSEHIDNYRVGVFSGAMVDNAPYSGRAFMVPVWERIADDDVRALLELDKDQITIIDQRALATFAQRVMETKAIAVAARLSPPNPLPATS